MRLRVPVDWLAPYAAVFVLISVSAAAQNSRETLHAADGNARVMVTSITIPPKTGAPFTATVTADITRPTGQGTTKSIHNHRLVVRDSQGRIYQERRQLTPNGDSRETRMWRFEISDPAQHIKYFCDPQGKLCEIRDYYQTASAPTAPVGPLDNEGERYLSRENLGTQTIVGVEAIGTRETVIENAKGQGDQAENSYTKEFWYSPRLDLNLIVKRFDPVNGTQVFNVAEISLAEPDARLFAVPPGFKVVDARSPVNDADQKPPTQ